MTSVKTNLQSAHSPSMNPMSPKSLPLMGKPLQIIFVEKQQKDSKAPGWRVGVNEDNLQEFVKNLKQLKPKNISIVSVLGQFRTGKSFLLDLMLKYLQCKKSGDKDWFKGTLEGQSEYYFTFRKQRERVTTGIWVYSRPYMLNGTAMVLMDTQGLFDLKTPMEINKAVFSLSTLLSSYQIVNIQNRISEDALQAIEFFTEFARSAVELNNKEATTKVDVDNFAFQRLEFLIRDYQHYEYEDDDEVDYKACRKQMADFLAETFATDKHDEGTRKRIMGMFNPISCFGLPYPGKCVNRNSWNGDLSEINKDFKILIEKYFEEMFSIGLTPKNPLFPEQDMDVILFENYIRSFTEVFRNGKLPQAVNLCKAFAQSIHLNAKGSATSMYQQEMERLMNTSEYIEEEELIRRHKAAEERSLGEFENKSQYGKKGDRVIILKELKTEIIRQFGEIEKINKARMSELLSRYAPFVLLAVVLFIFDKISDYTCDWWLHECVQFSYLASSFYLLTLVGLVFVSYRVYSSKGQTVLVKSFAGLTGEVMHEAGVWYERLIRKYRQLTGDTTGETANDEKQTTKKGKED